MVEVRIKKARLSISLSDFRRQEKRDTISPLAILIMPDLPLDEQTRTKTILNRQGLQFRGKVMLKRQNPGQYPV